MTTTPWEYGISATVKCWDENKYPTTSATYYEDGHIEFEFIEDSDGKVEPENNCGTPTVIGG